MEHERIHRTSSWSPTFQKREPASVEPALTVQKQTAPTPSPETPGTYTSPVPSDWVQQDPVMRRIMTNNPVIMKILQQQSELGIATEGNVSTNNLGQESIQLKCASCTAGDSVQALESELQQHDSNGSATEVQLAAKGEKPSQSQIQQVAATGFSGSSTSLPHLNQIQQSFGVDLSTVQAYIGGGAATACQQMGAAAYASGNRIAFKEHPSLELAAHEAAHVVQQASGKVQLAGGVGQVGDEYENHADAVAAKVVAGQKVDRLLSPYKDTNSHDANNLQAKQEQKIDKPITQLSATLGNSPVQLYQDIPDRGGQRFRLSDDSSVLVRQEGYGSQDIWAAPGKVPDSNQILKNVDSGIELVENRNDRITVPAQKNQRKTLVRVIPINKLHNICTPNMSLWADCGRAARQVIGGENGTRGVYKDPARGERNPKLKKTGSSVLIVLIF